MLHIYHPDEPGILYEAWPASNLEILPISPRLFMRDNDLFLEHYKTSLPQLLEIGDYVVRREGDFRLLRLSARDFTKFKVYVPKGTVSSFRELGPTDEGLQRPHP